VVVTSTTELATEVYAREVIQVAKCTARKAPESRISPTCFRFNRRSSSRFCQANGSRIRLAKDSR